MDSTHTDNIKSKPTHKPAVSLKKKASHQINNKTDGIKNVVQIDGQQISVTQSNNSRQQFNKSHQSLPNLKDYYSQSQQQQNSQQQMQTQVSSEKKKIQGINQNQDDQPVIVNNKTKDALKSEKLSIETYSSQGGIFPTIGSNNNPPQTTKNKNLVYQSYGQVGAQGGLNHGIIAQQKGIFTSGSLRDNYGNFYKNLMKPQGGHILNKLYHTKGENTKSQRNLSLSSPIDKNLGLNIANQVHGGVAANNNNNNLNFAINPYEQLRNAKDSFAQMINVINQSVNLSTEQPTSTLHEINTFNSQTYITATNVLETQDPESSLQQTLKKEKSLTLDQYQAQMTTSMSTKDILLQKPENLYRDYTNDQNIKTLQNLSQAQQQLQEKLVLRNHIKQFQEDSVYVEELSKQIEMKRGPIDEDRVFLNCFKNMEQVFGRRDVKTFQKIIQDMIDEQLPLGQLIDQQEIDQLMENKFYRGFSLTPEVKDTIRQGLEDEYNLSINYLEELLSDKQYCEKVNQSYVRHLKRYLDDLKILSIIKENKNQEQIDQNESVIEQFKRFKIQHKINDLEKQQQELDGNGTIIMNPNDSKYTSFILYIALQEMIKQVYVGCRDKGHFFLQLFNKYFEQQEKNWFKIIVQMNEIIETLKKDREFLLDKYIDKNNRAVANAIIKKEFKQVLESKEVTESNLIEHKRLIKELIGFLNREEDERYLVDLERKNVEKDVRDIISQWDLVRSNIEFKERIKNINTEKIKEDFMVNEQVRQMKREDFAVLVNLERIRGALSNKGNIKWDLEKIQMEGQNKLYKEESIVMKKEMRALRETLEINLEQLQERAKEIFELQTHLKKYTDRLSIVDKENIEIQTMVSFKHEHFTTTIDQIIHNKLNNKLKAVVKLMKKASANVQNYQPMSKQEMMDLISGAYIKKSQEIGTKNEIYMQFDDFFYSILVQRFGTKKKIDQKGQEFFLALKKYANEDERVDFFKHFVGYEESHVYQREVLEFYIRLMKTTNEPVQNLMSLPIDNEIKSPCQKVFIEYNQAFEKYLTVFKNGSTQLKEELKKHLIFDCELFLEGQPRLEVKLNDKWELYAMLFFFKNVMKDQSYTSNIEKVIVEKLNLDEENNFKLAVEQKEFEKIFEQYLGENDCKTVFDLIAREEFYPKYFGQLMYIEEDFGEHLGKRMIKIKGLKKLFRERYDFKISIRKFLDLGIKMSIRFLEEAKVYYGKIFSVFDRDGDGTIDFSEFRKIIQKVDPQRADWKIHAIFQKATGVEDPHLGAINFEEFIKCSMNNVLMEDMIDWEKVVIEDKDKIGNLKLPKNQTNGPRSGRQQSQGNLLVSLQSKGTLRERNSMIMHKKGSTKDLSTYT